MAKYNWKDVDAAVVAVRALIATKDNLPLAYVHTQALADEISRDIETRADGIAMMINNIATELDPTDDLPF